MEKQNPISDLSFGDTDVFLIGSLFLHQKAKTKGTNQYQSPVKSTAKSAVTMEKANSLVFGPRNFDDYCYFN